VSYEVPRASFLCFASSAAKRIVGLCPRGATLGEEPKESASGLGATEEPARLGATEEPARRAGSSGGCSATE